MKLHELKNTYRKKKKIQRIGRGPGSKRGKTSCRGVKGDGSRSGYRRRYGYEGGGLPLYKKLPTRGFTRGRFTKIDVEINLAQIEQLFQEGEKVTLQTLKEKRYAPKRATGILRILGKGELTKKVLIESHYITKSAVEKLTKLKVPHTILER